MSEYIVEKSLKKARWCLPEVALDDVSLLVQRFGVPEIVARLLCQRGVMFENVERFLKPTLKNDFPDPFSLKGMGDMAEDAAIAIEDGQSFAIFGDFDVDGATSSAVLYRFLKAVGISASTYIPDRLTEGYGPNIDALKSIKEQGADILFILDCGTTAFDVIEAGRGIGLQIIIIDHHEAEEKLPACWHLINPKRKDDESGLDMLAAVGVTLLSCVAINNRLKDRGFYTKCGRPEADLKQLLDLVALGTVCDMVPLTGANRLFVRTGFARPEGDLNVGIAALMHVAKISGPISTYDCGFVLGPRINAGSRVHKSDLGAQILSSDDFEECKNIAWTLNDCNDKRKAIQQEMEQQAIAMIEERGMQDDPMILIAHEDWHPGLSGLVAGRLKEQYQKPTCVVTYAKSLDGRLEGRGSGRSIAGIHIAQSFIDARNEGLLEKGGGHAMAGGFTVLPEKLEELQRFLCAHIVQQLNGADINVETHIDGILTVRGITTDLVEVLQNKMGPFGQEYPEPLFMLQNVRVHKADVLGQSHIRVMVSDWEGGSRVKAMAFKSVGTEFGDALLGGATKPFNLLGRLTINEWQGRKTAEMHLVDAAYDTDHCSTA
ncbi:MAG: single-stranded-DNA-specific exonuclease RecJ [Alphaproteobacteria bacterium]